MKLKYPLMFAAACLAVAVPAWLVDAADHSDSPAAIAEPTADLADLYAWMNSDASKLNLVMTLPGGAMEFSDAVTYVFHVNSATGYQEDQTETPITCKFYKADGIECWAGDAYVEGDPSNVAGLANDEGTLKVFAGLRDDPFFFELQGFQAVAQTVREVTPALIEDDAFDEAGCPSLDSATRTELATQLQSGPKEDDMFTDPSNTFAGADVLAIAVEIDKSLVNTGGDILSVWASTHRDN